MALALEPAPLHVLAEHLRDGTWLDLRTAEGPIYRVRIMEIVVRMADEALVCAQEWYDELRERRTRRKLVLTAEDVWRVQPTTLTVFEVKPYGEQTPPKPRELGTGTLDVLKEAIATAAADLVDTSSAAVMADTKGGRRFTQVRYVAMLVMYEMTDLSIPKITDYYGYGSPTPFYSAQSALKYDHNKFVCAENMRKVASKVDKATAPSRFRTDRPFPQDYNRALGK